MVLGADGERLSKRHGATSVGAWRARGVPPEALVNGLALLGWAPSGDKTIVTLGEMIAEFDLDRVGRSAAIFDPVKLDWISAQHVHAMAPDRLASEVTRALVSAGRLEGAVASASAPWIASVAEFLRPALGRFDQVDVQAEPLFHPGGPLSDADRALLNEPLAREVLLALAERLEADADGQACWNAVRKELESISGAKGKALFQPSSIAFGPSSRRDRIHSRAWCRRHGRGWIRPSRSSGEARGGRAARVFVRRSRRNRSVGGWETIDRPSARL
jgi:glutamyl/glutaminyl-tRNA synthetase